MPEHVFREVHPEEFEGHIKRASQADLDQERDYTGKKTYLNQDNTVGYSLRNDGYWGNLFSLVKGGGAAATQDAITRGALWGTAFDRQGSQNLIEYYKRFGMKPFAREKNWDEGGPDVVHVKFDHAPIPHEIAQKIQQGVAQPEEGMVKAERRSIFSMIRKTPHPHAYEWHDGHTLHHKHIAKADLTDEADVGKQFQHALNEQVATVGVPTYIEYAKHYGTINKAIPPHDSAYNYRGLSDKINDLIKQHGYEVYYAGGKYGKADLANKNYDTKHLMIYDPTPDSGGDQGDLEQTDNWRKVHELAHALTREDVNNSLIPGFGDARYGERPRMGRLGKQRTLRDAMRAIHWEALAVQKQRELSEQLGVKIPDEAFNMEWNTNQHDATHRAVTGRFSEPRKEGFHPSSEPVPLEFSLGLARKAAEQMGMKGLDDLKGMAKSERLSKAQALLAQLNKALKDLPKPQRSTKVSPNESEHDYTHMLPDHLQKQGYEMSVAEKNSIFNNNSLHATISHPVDGQVAHVFGYVFDSNNGKIHFLNPHANGVHPNHQGNKLGFHAYEAMLNHAYNQIGITQMRPGVHSGFAEKVHQALAAKHGFQILQPSAPLRTAVPYDAPSANPYFMPTRVMLTQDESSYALAPHEIGDVKVPATPEHVGRIRATFDRIRSLMQRGEQWLGLN